MFLVKFLTFLSKILGAQTIDPNSVGSSFGGYAWNSFVAGISQLFTWVCEVVFYGISKWLLAFTDFLQYFIQKLIGLDYWLNTPRYTIQGALKADLLFSFLYNDTVQKTFRALVGVFLVLLIIFTVFAIIRSEWQYITGSGKKGEFGDGSNSKTSIIRNAIKAIALVIIFPIMLILGIISSDAILASLVRALNIDTGSTFGQQIFNVSTQSANKYRNYASGDRSAITDKISFYINDEDKYIYLNNTYQENALAIGYSDYYQYLNAISNATKYSVDTIFDSININSFNNSNLFNGYCIRMDIDGEKKFFFVKKRDGVASENYNTPEAYYYYLNNVLQVDVISVLFFAEITST